MWTSKRLKSLSIAPREATYKVIPSTSLEAVLISEKKLIFQALSIGDNRGQAFIVPLDESSREVAEYILRAIAAYDGE